MEALYRVPICGGFCAPTVSPEQDCYRHVSNEYTVAGGPLLFKRRAYLENSRFCNFFGKCGFTWGDPIRKPVMMCAMAGNLVVIAFLLVAAFGTTLDGKTLTKFYWASGHSTVQPFGIDVESFIGVRMRYDRVDCSGSFNATICTHFFESKGYTLDDGWLGRELEWSDEETCEQEPGEYNAEAEAIKEACASCKSIGYSTQSLWMSCLTQLPTAATNCQRSTRFGDVNCQATMGFLSNMVTMYLGLVAMGAWHTACYMDMPDSIHGSPIHWELGTGFMLLFIATCFKFVDAVLHFIVPTPVRVERPSTKTLEDYMMLAYQNEGPDNAALLGKQA